MYEYLLYVWITLLAENSTICFISDPNDINTNTICTSEYELDLENSLKLIGTGVLDKAPGNCDYSFTAVSGNAECAKKGICYLFDANNFFRDPSVRLKVGGKVNIVFGFSILHKMLHSNCFC